MATDGEPESHRSCSAIGEVRLSQVSWPNLLVYVVRDLPERGYDFQGCNCGRGRHALPCNEIGIASAAHRIRDHIDFPRHGTKSLVARCLERGCAVPSTAKRP